MRFPVGHGVGHGGRARPTWMMPLQRAVLAVAVSTLVVTQPLNHQALAMTAPTTDCNAKSPCTEKVDFGSCGNACCALEYDITGPTQDMTAALRIALTDGGPDGRFTLPPLEGGKPGFNDLRAYGVPADFIGQAVHTTQDRNFRDTINFAVRPGAGGKGTIVRAFSISNIVSHPLLVLSCHHMHAIA